MKVYVNSTIAWHFFWGGGWGWGEYGSIECFLIEYKVCEIFDGYLMDSLHCSFDK